MSENDMIEVDYKCPDCGFIVRFFEGFIMQCNSKPNRVAHSFTVNQES